jgi:hypothetical protein
MMPDGTCGVDNGFEAAMDGSEASRFTVFNGRLVGELIREFREGQTNLGGPRCLEMREGKTVKCIAVSLGHIIGITQPNVVRATQQGIALRLDAAYLLGGLAEEPVGRTLDEDRTDVDADIGDSVWFAPAHGEVIASGGRNSHGVLALGGTKNPDLIDVNEQGDVL